MKIISGILKGRNIDGYNIEGTRPTMDRVKESIFSTIQFYIKNSIVLDLFSGSGNYSFESYSNGAKTLYLNDKNMKCINFIKDTINKFNCDKKAFNLTNMDYNDCLNYYKNKNIKFNLIFLDPPYKMNICSQIIDYLYNNDMLLDNALIIVEISGVFSLTKYEKLSLYKEKSYGDKSVFIYKYRV